MDKPICFYHSADLDGVCSAAIVHHFYKGDVDLYPINYGDKFPWEEIQNRDVLMIDFSLQPFHDMLRLLTKAKCLIWIDHHQTAIDEYEDWSNQTGGTMNCVLEVGKAACELTWERFSKMHATAPPLPQAVYLLGRYDVWHKENPAWESDILPFQWGMRALNLKPTDKTWSLLFEGNATLCRETLQNGRRIFDYQRDQDARVAKGSCFPVTIKGPVEDLRAIAVNRSNISSNFFHAVWDPEKYDVMLGFCLRRDGQWAVSLYSDKPEIDCGAMAKARGGGGHRGAAGFQWKGDITLLIKDGF